MSTTTWQAKCSADAVFAVLSDGWLYSTWVVGASRIRAVEAGWPAKGTRIHHSVGAWPLLIDDSTTVLEVEPDRRLVLQARAWPTGEAHVDIRLEANASGCQITLVEDVVAGPATLIPQVVRQPLFRARNRETLRRLGLLAEGR
jgi:hypothetical protein